MVDKLSIKITKYKLLLYRQLCIIMEKQIDTLEERLALLKKKYSQVYKISYSDTCSIEKHKEVLQVNEHNCVVDVDKHILYIGSDKELNLSHCPSDLKTTIVKTKYTSTQQFKKQIDPATKFPVYGLCCHGSRIKNDYIVLPPGIRVVMLCFETYCPSIFEFEISSFKLMLNDINAELDNFDYSIFSRDSHKFNACVFSGNSDGKFSFYGCENKKSNMIPNLEISAETQLKFRDGLYKLPIKPKIVNRDSGEILVTETEIRNEILSLTPENKETNKAGMFVSSRIAKQNNGKLVLDSVAYNIDDKLTEFQDNTNLYNATIYYDEEPDDIPADKNTSLRHVIDHLIEKESFKQTKCVITLFLFTCTGSVWDYHGEPKWCLNDLNSYNNTLTSFIDDSNILKTGFTLSSYDLTMANKLFVGGYLQHKINKYTNKCAKNNEKSNHNKQKYEKKLLYYISKQL